jgi:hypothetical protein
LAAEVGDLLLRRESPGLAPYIVRPASHILQPPMVISSLKRNIYLVDHHLVLGSEQRRVAAQAAHLDSQGFVKVAFSEITMHTSYYLLVDNP